MSKKKISDYTALAFADKVGTEKLLLEKADNSYSYMTVDDVRLNLASLDENGLVQSSQLPSNLVTTTGATSNFILGANAAGTGYEYKELVAGNQITITHDQGSILIAAGTVTNNATQNSGAIPDTLVLRDASGNVYANNFISTSDLAIKENITDISNPLESVMNLLGHKFRLKNTEKDSYGFLAQEIEQVLPEVVFTNDDGFKSVSYSAIIGVLVEAVKELIIKVKQLEIK